MITFKELRRSLDQAVCEQEVFKDISELLDLIEGLFMCLEQIPAKSWPNQYLITNQQKIKRIPYENH